MSQHAGSECNGTHLIQYRRVNFKTILKVKNENRVCRAQNYVFPNNKGVKRPIAKYTSL